MSEYEAPVSNAIGRVGAGPKFGWRVGTKSEVVVVEATTADAGATVAESTVAAMWAEADNGVGEWMSPMRVSNR